MTTNEQTEIELPEMALPPELPPDEEPSVVLASPPEPKRGGPATATFTMEVTLPYRFGDPRCCIYYGAELFTDERDNAWVTHTHETDCEVWRFLP